MVNPYRPPALRDVLAAAFLEGLRDRPTIAPTDPATVIRLDDTGRAPVVPLRPRGTCFAHPGQWCRWNPNCRSCV